MKEFKFGAYAMNGCLVELSVTAENLSEADAVARDILLSGRKVLMPKGVFYMGQETHKEHEAPVWSRVEDQLPKEDERVLVWIDSERSYTKIDTDRMLDGKWVRWGSDVTHWMPAPEPPKGLEASLSDKIANAGARSAETGQREARKEDLMQE